MDDKIRYPKYDTSPDKSSVRKDGHFMFPDDIVKELKRKNYLEKKLKALSKNKDSAALDCGILIIANEIHKNAKDHGWWEEKRTIPELLCLVHSEVSEALEAYRVNDNDNFKEELADIVIRVFDMSIGLGINIQSEIFKKHKINEKRSFKHGNKKI